MLPSAHRLHKEGIDEVFRRGKPLFVMDIGIRFQANDQKATKFAFLIAKKYAKKASARNRFKRMVREATRSLQKKWPEGYNIVVFVVKKPTHISRESLEASLSLIFSKIR
ncbi:MAG: ribonuclease P protein component [Candidatus Moranbacteria bacterium]|nr:ribonuclease P protein component [Candidatus Moranbacteria bacterium]